MAILAILASLFGCGKNTPFEPQILDGPGMEYVDSEYRNDYANCLPFDDIQGEPYLAVAYLGKGEIGKENKNVCRRPCTIRYGASGIPLANSFQRTPQYVGERLVLHQKSRYNYSFIYHRIMVLNELRMGEWKLWNG